MSETVQQIKRRVEELSCLSRQTNEDINVMNEAAWQLRITDVQVAQSISSDALRLSQKNDYRRGQAYAHRNLGFCRFYTGQNVEAERLLEVSRQMFSTISDEAGMADVLNGLGATHLARDDYQNVIECCSTALALYQKTNNNFDAAVVHNNLGTVFNRLGDYAAALDHYYRALPLVIESQADLQQAWLYVGLGEVLSYLGETNAAIEYLEQSVTFLRGYQVERHECVSLSNLGAAYQLRRDYQKASESYSKSLKIADELEYAEMQAEVHCRIGVAYLETENFELALANLDAAHQFSITLPSRFHECEILLNLGIAALRTNDFKQAAKYLSKALYLSEKFKFKENNCKIHLALSEVYGKLSQTQAALNHHQLFFQTYQDLYGLHQMSKIRCLWLKKGVEMLSDKTILHQSNVRIKREKSVGISALPQRKLGKVFEFIENHLEQNISVKEIANVLALNPDYFARCFKQSTGKTPHQFLLEKRIKRAQHLLETTALPIAEIALACGFSNQSHLTAHFRLATGRTPNQARQEI